MRQGPRVLRNVPHLEGVDDEARGVVLHAGGGDEGRRGEGVAPPRGAAQQRGVHQDGKPGAPAEPHTLVGAVHEVVILPRPTMAFQRAVGIMEDEGASGAEVPLARLHMEGLGAEGAHDGAAVRHDDDDNVLEPKDVVVEGMEADAMLEGAVAELPPLRVPALDRQALGEFKQLFVRQHGGACPVGSLEHREGHGVAVGVPGAAGPREGGDGADMGAVEKKIPERC